MELPANIGNDIRQLLNSLPDRELKNTYLRELKVWDFLSKNRDKQLSDNGITLRFSQSAPDSDIRMYIAVDDDTTIDSIRDAWWFVLEWRERLKQYQGPDIETGFTQFFFSYLKDIKAGYSYTAIANMINQTIIAYLLDGNEQLKIRGTNKPSPTPIVCAAGLMTLMGLKEDDVQQWIISGLKNIQDGQPPFSPDTPIDDRRVIERLRKPPQKVRGAQIYTLYYDWLMDEINSQEEE